MDVSPHVNKNPDDVIHELGGCGRMQIRIVLMVHIIKTIICWSLMSMVFVNATPKSWWCAENHIRVSENATETVNISERVTCTTGNQTTCSKFHFDTEMRTIVTEWSLVCDLAWVPATVVTIQVGFQLFGNFFAGHLADALGRKIPFFSSIILLILSNLACYFSVSWAMFAVCRVFVGIGAGFFLTTQYSYSSEFTLARWRAWLIGFPSWAMQVCVLALILWLLQDWRSVHLVIALTGVPFLAAWWFMPESFRWYYAHDRIDEAEKVITEIAKFNRRPLPDMTYMKQLTAKDTTEDQKYTVLSLFKTKFLIKATLLLSINWIALGLVTYGITFGIQKLAGSIYLNLFLFQLSIIPAKGIAIWLQNRFGRQKTSILVFIVTGISALIVGIVQYIDTDKRDALTNGFAMVANLGINTGAGPVQTMTIEMYPTVIRGTAFGFCSVLARVGAAVGPQLVFLELYVPGILYFLCAAVSFACVMGLFWLPETKDANLSDKLNEPRQKSAVNGAI